MHWVLKEYRNDAGSRSTWFRSRSRRDLPLPFSLRVDDPTPTARLNDSLYQRRRSGTAIDDGSR